MLILFCIYNYIYTHMRRSRKSGIGMFRKQILHLKKMWLNQQKFCWFRNIIFLLYLELFTPINSDFCTKKIEEQHFLTHLSVPRGVDEKSTVLLKN